MRGFSFGLQNDKLRQISVVWGIPDIKLLKIKYCNLRSKDYVVK